VHACVSTAKMSLHYHACISHTAILIIIEGQFQAFQAVSWPPIIMRMAVSCMHFSYLIPDAYCREQCRSQTFHKDAVQQTFHNTKSKMITPTHTHTHIHTYRASSYICSHLNNRGESCTTDEVYFVAHNDNIHAHIYTHIQIEQVHIYAVTSITEVSLAPRRSGTSWLTMTTVPS
jgi:hypothetical protein